MLERIAMVLIFAPLVVPFFGYCFTRLGRRRYRDRKADANQR